MLSSEWSIHKFEINLQGGRGNTLLN